MTGSAEPRGVELPRLHIVTNDLVLRAPEFAATAERLLREGGDRVAIHLRGRGLGGGEMWGHASRLTKLARATGSWLIVNDRIDVALGCLAHGVQLGRGSVPPVKARRLLGEGARVGVSVHNLAEVIDAAEGGADFLLAGTLFTSPTHPDGAPTGVGWLREAAALGLPVIGIGGIEGLRVREVIAAGAYGVAAISALWEADDPGGAVRQLLEELERP